MKNDIKNILISHFPAYNRQHKQPLRVLKAIEAQIICRTEKLGKTRYQCPNQDSQVDIYHSCRNRSCTICGFKKQKDWLDQQKKRLLNCPHFHVVFTLPSEYRSLWLYNRKWFIQTQFYVSSKVLKTLLTQQKNKTSNYPTYLGATPGIISALHTWGRQLNLHPHIHCLVTGGGLTDDHQWKPVKNNFLLPAKVLKAHYRSLFQSCIKTLIESDGVKLPPGKTKQNLLSLHKRLFQKEWSVRIQPQYAHGKGVLNYLSRYLGARPLNPGQIIAMNHKEIIFNYKDHRKGRNEKLSLPINEFMRRLLIHQGDIGIHTMRYYGIYASQAKNKWKFVHRILSKTTDIREENTQLKDSIRKANQIFCECCGAIMQPVYIRYQKRWIENSIIERVPLHSVAKKVQQSVELDRPNIGFT